MTPSKALFLLGIGWIFGIFLHSFNSFGNQASLIPIDARGILVFLCIAIFSITLFRSKGLPVGFLLFTLCLGILYHSLAIEKEQEKANAFTPFFNKEVVIQGRISKEPEERHGNARLQISSQGFRGEVMAFTSPGHSLRYGDMIQAQGLLEEAPVFEGFDYRAFLWKEGVFAVMRNPEITIVRKEAYQSPGEFLYAKLLVWKEGRREELYQTFSSLEGAVLGATLLADKRMWTKGFEERLNATGLTHITAISGQHVAIFITIFIPLLLWLGLWKQQAYWITLLLVGVFILLTGGDAAALRGGCMGSLASLGIIWGRQSQGIRLLVIAGAVMLFFNPFLLARDAGFQLSFLALFGILLFSPRLQRFLMFLPKDFGIREAGAMTVAAQVFTTPLLFILFGSVSLVSPITNIIIAPIVPLLLSLGILFLCFSWFSALFIIPLHILLFYFILVVDSFSALHL